MLSDVEAGGWQVIAVMKKEENKNILIGYKNYGRGDVDL